MKLKTGNLFQGIPPAAEEEACDLLAKSQDLKIERIVSRGHSAPETGWFEPTDSEWVILLQGAAVLSFPDRPDFRMEPGDHVQIPPGCRHRLEWTEPDTDTVWLAVHYRDE